LIRAVDVASLLLVHHKKVTPPGSPGNVNVLANLDKAVRAKDGQPAVAPRGQPIGCEPIHADVPSATIAAQHQIAKILKIWILLVVNIAHLRGDNVGSLRVGKK